MKPLFHLMLPLPLEQYRWIDITFEGTSGELTFTADRLIGRTLVFLGVSFLRRSVNVL